MSEYEDQVAVAAAQAGESVAEESAELTELTGEADLIALEAAAEVDCVLGREDSGAVDDGLAEQDHPDRGDVDPAEIAEAGSADVDLDYYEETALEAEERAAAATLALAREEDDDLRELYREVAGELASLEQRGSLTVIAGLPAAGKSTLAARRAAESGALLIDKDSVNALEPELAARLGTGRYDRDSRDYHAAVAPATRAMLRAAVKAAMDGGLDVVVDAPMLGLAREALLGGFYGRSFAMRIRHWLGIGDDVMVTVVWVFADSPVRRARMKARAARRDSVKLADWEAYDWSLGALLHPLAPALLTAAEGERTIGEVVDTSGAGASDG